MPGRVALVKCYASWPVYLLSKRPPSSPSFQGRLTRRNRGWCGARRLDGLAWRSASQLAIAVDRWALLGTGPSGRRHVSPTEEDSLDYQ
jgi:hypothetical protein